MDGLYSFLIFVVIIVINMLFQRAKNKARYQKRKLPPKVYKEDFPPEQEKNPTRGERPLDYMMVRPKAQNVDKTEVYTESEIVEEKISVEPQKDDVNNIYQEYLKQKEQQLHHKEMKDYIQNTEIKSTDEKKKVQIDIAHESIMNAIMYAQVLEMPKSIYYLKRYGIKRIIHKD